MPRKIQQITVTDTTPESNEMGVVVRPIGGSGGGPVTIAEGADVAQGSTTDAAITTDSPGTVIGFLRGLVTILSDVWDDINNRLNIAVTNTVAVTGTFFQAIQPVSAIDLDIRNLTFATDKVDISGSSGVGVTGPLTNAELRATPVPVSGIVTVTGPVTIDEPVTVDAVDLDIRNLVFATDKVDVSGSAVTLPEVTVDYGLQFLLKGLQVMVRDNSSLIMLPIAASNTPPGAGDFGILVRNIEDPSFVQNVRLFDSFITQPVSAVDLDIRNLVFATDKVDVSGSTVTVNATDLDIRNLTFATDKVDVTGSVVSSKIPLTASAPTSASVGVASAQIVAANAARKGLVITNISGNRDVFLGIGTPAILNSGITLLRNGGTWTMDEYTFVTGAINAIASGAAAPVTIQEFTT